jgi:hypothetical protein
MGTETVLNLWDKRAKKNPPKQFSEGDKVRFDIAAMKSQPDYKRLVPRYRNFIESNEGKVFTVKYDKGKKNSNVVCLEEDPSGWLFYTGELVSAVEVSSFVKFIRRVTGYIERRILDFIWRIRCWAFSP